MANFDIWQFLAGLGIFLFGMLYIEEALKNLAGRAFKQFLRRYTRNPMQGILKRQQVGIQCQPLSEGSGPGL